MSSLGSLWDQDYSQRATDYSRDLEDRVHEDEGSQDSEDEGNLGEKADGKHPGQGSKCGQILVSQPQQSFRL